MEQKHIYHDSMQGKKFTGEVFDTLINIHTGEKKEIYQSFNIVVKDISKLIAALFKTEPGYGGLSYWEVGSGNASWNDTAPPPPTEDDKELLTPTYRKAIAPSDINFLDASNNIVNVPTNKLEVSVTFGSSEANGYLREFGIFGGNATSTLKSGIMINRKTHGLIFKTSSLELKRTIRFTL